MKLTLGDLVSAETALNALVTTERVVSAATSYKVARLVKSVATHLEPFHKERNALLERLGTKQEGSDNGTATYTLDGPKALEFSTQLNELMMTEVEVEKWLLSIELLGEYQPSTQHMLALLPLIVDPE